MFASSWWTNWDLIERKYSGETNLQPETHFYVSSPEILSYFPEFSLLSGFFMWSLSETQHHTVLFSY